MPHSNIITAPNEKELWKIIEDQLANKKEEVDYSVQFECGDHCIDIDIDFHPETYSETGNPTTTFSSPLADDTPFRFRIVKQGFRSAIQKLFGMQDVVIGNDEFDRAFIIQTNDEEKVKSMLSDTAVSTPLLEHAVDFFEIKDLKIGANHQVVLTLDVEDQITEHGRLQEIYQAFSKALEYVD